MDDARSHTHNYSQDPNHSEPQSSGPASLRDARAEFDRVYLGRLLQVTGGNIGEAAAIAEIHPKSFERLMRRRGIRRSRT